MLSMLHFVTEFNLIYIQKVLKISCLAVPLEIMCQMLMITFEKMSFAPFRIRGWVRLVNFIILITIMD